MDYKQQAEENLLALSKNPYPGRGIIAGVDESGENLIQVYWIMGRSENSRNRIFIKEPEGILKTAPADPSKVKDPSLIIYTAMAENEENQVYAVSNGEQTKDALWNGLYHSMRKWRYEPDEPNFTPRITALSASIGMENPYTVEISILKKSLFSAICDRITYILSPFYGVGYCITTYSGDGNPLPSFKGDPYLLPLIGDKKTIAQTIWNALNEENRVSLAVKFISTKTGESEIEIINKYKAVS